MKGLRLSALILCAAFASGANALPFDSTRGAGALGASKTETLSQNAVRYRLDASQSKFIARAFAGGPLWFKGHDHFVAARDFSGEAQLTPGESVGASLRMTVRAESLVETRDLFTEQQKQIINKELREIVLESS